MAGASHRSKWLPIALFAAATLVGGGAARAGDGKTDLVVSNNDGTVTVFLNSTP